MGYYVFLEEADWVLPREHYVEALQRLKDLNHDPSAEKVKGEETSWFSWMPPDYDQKVSSAREVFEMLDFSCEETEDGLLLSGYDSKMGDEDQFLAAIADLVKSGSYLIWRGETGETWKQVFTPDGMTVHQGYVSFDPELDTELRNAVGLLARMTKFAPDYSVTVKPFADAHQDACAALDRLQKLGVEEAH